MFQRFCITVAIIIYLLFGWFIRVNYLCVTKGDMQGVRYHAKCFLNRTGPVDRFL